jgi:hypothetical protein
MSTLGISEEFLTDCQIGEECISSVMNMIEVDPEPFILELEIVTCDSKLCEAVSNPGLPGELQGPPIEYFIGRQELLEFMFSNEFLPIVALVPLPASFFFLMAAVVFLIWKGRNRVTA